MDESKVTMKGRLGPGMMITADLRSGQVGKEIELYNLVGASIKLPGLYVFIISIWPFATSLLNHFCQFF